MTRLRLGDVTYAVHEWLGSGEPLLLLHGFTGRAALWDPVAKTLAPTRRVLAVDLLGHGDTDAPADPARYGMERAVADLAALLDRLGIARTACLGYSMGGRLALAFALAHPERVTALMLESASPGLATAHERAQRAAADDALASRIEAVGIAAFVDEWMRQPLFASQARLGDAARAEAGRGRLVNRPHGLANSLRGMGCGAQPACWQELGTLSVPTLLLAGADDTKFRAIAEAMARDLPTARVEVLPGAGHCIHLENPDAFCARVDEFLAAACCTGGALRQAQGERSLGASDERNLGAGERNLGASTESWRQRRTESRGGRTESWRQR